MLSHDKFNNRRAKWIWGLQNLFSKSGKSFYLIFFILVFALFGGKCQDPEGMGVLLIGIETLPVEGTPLEGLSGLTIKVQEVKVVHRTDKADPSTESLITIDSEEREIEFPTAGFPPREVARYYVPEGFVYQIRIICSEGTIVVFSESHGVKIPSGMQSGLKIVPNDEEPFQIIKDEYTTVLVKFDPSDRIVKNQGIGYILKPVLYAELSDFTELSGYIVDQIIIKLKEDRTLNDLQDFNLEHGIEILETSDCPRYYLLKIPTSLSLEEGLEFCYDSDIFDVISPNAIVPPPSPLIPAEGLDVYHTAGRLEQTWDHSIGSKNIKIGIIDTCIDLDNADLIENININHLEVPQAVLDAIGDYNSDGTTNWHDLDLNDDDILRFSELTTLVNSGFVVCEVSRNPNPFFAGDICDPLDLVSVSDNTLWEDNIDSEEDANNKVDDIVGWNLESGNNVPDCESNGIALTGINIHATEAAQVVAAVGNNTHPVTGDPIGVAGVMWEASIVPVAMKIDIYSQLNAAYYLKVFNPHIDAMLMEAAIIWIKDRKFDPLPDGIPAECQHKVEDVRSDKFNKWVGQIEDMVDDHIEKSDETIPFVVVFPAGNCYENLDREDVLGFYGEIQRPWAITVTAVSWSPYYDFGTWAEPVVKRSCAFGTGHVHIGACDLGVTQCIHDGDCAINSTSMAAALTTGTVGLMLAYDSTLISNPAVTVERIKNTANGLLTDGKIENNKYLEVYNAVLNIVP